MVRSDLAPGSAPPDQEGRGISDPRAGWLVAEMALASDGEISEANKAIDAALAAGMESAAKPG